MIDFPVENNHQYNLVLNTPFVSFSFFSSSGCANIHNFDIDNTVTPNSSIYKFQFLQLTCHIVKLNSSLTNSRLRRPLLKCGKETVTGLK